MNPPVPVDFTNVVNQSKQFLARVPGIEPHRVAEFSSPFVAITVLKPGEALEGCLYAKKSKQKVVRTLAIPDHFSFLLLVLISLRLPS
jgi:hypothetical protein